MNKVVHRIKKSILCAALSTISIFIHPFDSHHTFILPRSQGFDAARELMGWEREINRYDVGCHYWSLYLAPTYMRSFDACALSNFLLGRTAFIFSGSQVADRSATDILADYFGLPRDFQSVVKFCPHITNYIFDINFYMGLDSVCQGLYYRIHVPIVHTKWELNMRECVINEGTAFFPAGYMGPERVEADQLAHSVIDAMHGTARIDGLDEPLVWGDMQEALAYGKIFQRDVKTRVAEVQLAVGWNFIQDTWYHAGLNLRTALPTGNTPCGEFLFEAVAGNGHHFELGAGFTSHVDVWQGQEWRCALYCDINAMHLFTNLERRSFEFKHNGGGSRYMLLQEITPGSTDLFLGVGGAAAPNQYARRLVPAINETTFCVNIEIPVQIDGVLKCAFYNTCGWEVDFGYDFWFRSAERLTCRERFADNLAFKGDAQVYGFTPPTLQTPIPLNATESRASIEGGQLGGNFGAGVQFANENVDSPIVATTDGGLMILQQLNDSDATELGIVAQPVNTSNPAILLTDADIDNCSALMPRAITHALFAHVGYRWQECGLLDPFLGMGFETEIAQHNAKHFGVSQWALVFKGGFSY